jgi:aminoglycoside 3-N-acetyltransferase
MTPQPPTQASLGADLRELGVTPGATLLVHASLSSLGWVVGGEQAVLGALRNALTDRGTLVMPVQSWQLCDPAYLDDPAVPREWWPLIREQLPAYDPLLTPTRMMGACAELLRTAPGSLRSAHPHRSFAANGPRARSIVARHDLDCPVGERSPLAALYDLGAGVLLLGVGYEKSTALHLAEHRAEYPGKRTVRNGAPVLRDGERRWVTWEELEVADDDFDAVGSAFVEETGRERRGRVARADARLLPMRDLVDFGARWFSEHRRAAQLEAPGSAGS